jgi:hypothetical protein
MGVTPSGAEVVVRARVRAGLAVAAVVLLGCGPSGDPAADAGIPVATDRCGAPSFPPVLFSPHLEPGEELPEPYSSTPATSGAHLADEPVLGVLEAPVHDRTLVTMLEVGHLVAAYDPDGLPPADTRALADLAGGDLASSLSVAPYDGRMDAPLVLNGWGVRQPCSGFDDAAVRRFVAAFGGRAPG